MAGCLLLMTEEVASELRIMTFNLTTMATCAKGIVGYYGALGGYLYFQYLFLYRERVSLYSPGWSTTHATLPTEC